MSYIVQSVIVGDTPDFTLYAKKDGSVWDITGATVLLYLRQPDGTVLSPFTATVSNGTAGIAHYQLTLTTTISTAGTWTRQWKVTLSSVVMWSDEIDMQVFRAAA